MELRSLLRKGTLWRCYRLGEQALLLKVEEGNHKLESVHEFTNAVQYSDIDGVTDIVPAYQTIALLFDEAKLDHDKLIKQIETILVSDKDDFRTSQLFRVPVCYELGLDWDEVERNTKLAKQEIIEEHTSKAYKIAMMGFTPGFVFLNGLNDNIWCPRRSSPRISIPKGSIGIGGEQTGIYSLESPGGWQIIGQTPVSFFNAEENPPSKLEAGDEIHFFPISKTEFEQFGMEF